MKSIKERINLLIKESKKFNFNNFCFPNDSSTQFNRYGGEDTPEWLSWKLRSVNVIRDVVAEGSPALKLAETGLAIITKGNYQDEFERAKDTILAALKQTFELIKHDKFNELKQTKSKSISFSLTNKIFVVHGHDQNLKTELENFLHHIGLDPIVLHKKPDEGQTIIEKFEKHSDVGYAFILLTPDEVAYSVKEEQLKDDKRKKEKRARPNVLFEFGYFIGKLGRKRVCCLYKGDVSLPSDLSGLIYKNIISSVDAEGVSIIQELEAAGYKIIFK